MNFPIVAVCGNYAAIADQQGNNIYICDETGCLGVATTVLPIFRITISSRGMVAAVMSIIFSGTALRWRSTSRAF